jgi:hypothetical protein
MQTFSGTLLAVVAAITTSMPIAERAAASEICPMFLVQCCVINRDGLRYTAWTNPCFAKKKGLRVLHRGTC